MAILAIKGCDESSLSWLESYLTLRYQFVKTKNEVSKPTKICKVSVPQEKDHSYLVYLSTIFLSLKSTEVLFFMQTTQL